MKTKILLLALLFILLFPTETKTSCHQAFSSFKEQLAISRIWMKHGAVRIAYDRKSFRRLNGEVCPLNFEEFNY